jgi:hypothetical protein
MAKEKPRGGFLQVICSKSEFRSQELQEFRRKRLAGTDEEVNAFESCEEATLEPARKMLRLSIL